jgi:threonine synthase
LKGIWKYRSFWPTINAGALITGGEGNTPLIRSSNIGKHFGIPNLYFKLETGNPTGSYKDRFAAAAVSHLKQTGAKMCLATSSGNTGAALAAYCAKANIPCFLIIVDGAPEGKVKQMKLYGARTLMVRGFGIDEAISNTVFNRLKALGAEMNTAVQISAYAFSPEGMKGVESIAFEIAEQLPGKQMKIFSPAGGGGLTLAVGNGFLKWQEQHDDYAPPQLYCVQPQGNNTIAGALISGSTVATPVVKSTTTVSGLQAPNIIDGNQTIEVCRKLNGGGQLVTDRRIFQVQQALAKMEGIYCEPAGATALAGAIQAKEAGSLSDQDQIVCLLTGHGFKDPNSADRMISKDKDYFESIEDATIYIHQQLAIV